MTKTILIQALSIPTPTHTHTHLLTHIHIHTFAFFALSSFGHRQRCHSGSRTPGALIGSHRWHRRRRGAPAAVHCGSAVLHNGAHGRDGRDVPQGQAFALGDRRRGKAGQVSWLNWAIYRVTSCWCYDNIALEMIRKKKTNTKQNHNKIFPHYSLFLVCFLFLFLFIFLPTFEKPKFSTSGFRIQLGLCAS